MEDKWYGLDSQKGCLARDATMQEYRIYIREQKCYKGITLKHHHPIGNVASEIVIKMHICKLTIVIFLLEP